MAYYRESDTTFNFVSCFEPPVISRGLRRVDRFACEHRLRSVHAIYQLKRPCYFSAHPAGYM